MLVVLAFETPSAARLSKRFLRFVRGTLSRLKRQHERIEVLVRQHQELQEFLPPTGELVDAKQIDGVEHAHLRDLSQRLSQRGESVLEYWRRTGRDLIQVSVDDGPDGPRAAQGGWRATASGRQLDRPPTTERDSLS